LFWKEKACTALGRDTGKRLRKCAISPPILVSMLPWYY
jgi:hypothetical protein